MLAAKGVVSLWVEVILLLSCHWSLEGDELNFILFYFIFLGGEVCYLLLPYSMYILVEGTFSVVQRPNLSQAVNEGTMFP